MTLNKRSPRLTPNQTGTEPLTLEENNSSDFNRTSESAFGALTARCPDCTAATWGQRLVHDETCPAAGAMDRVQDDDAAWFRANPRESVRRRPVTDAEVQEMGASGVTITSSMEAEIVQLRPGLRMRYYVEAGDQR